MIWHKLNKDDRTTWPPVFTNVLVWTDSLSFKTFVIPWYDPSEPYFCDVGSNKFSSMDEIQYWAYCDKPQWVDNEDWFLETGLMRWVNDTTRLAEHGSSVDESIQDDLTDWYKFDENDDTTWPQLDTLVFTRGCGLHLYIFTLPGSRMPENSNLPCFWDIDTGECRPLGQVQYWAYCHESIVKAARLRRAEGNS